MESKKQFTTIDEYIATFPKDVQNILKELRRVIRELAPETIETISYKIPTFDLHDKHLVFFAAYKNHISIYPVTDSMVEAFKEKLLPFRTGKGTLQFSLDKPIPFDLVKNIVKFRVNESKSKKK
ncbi:MAG: hypothetical protein QG670_726 [Thermoproteota archaeon]|nr:hypothetical protein [Thermoproteota archaeon]